MALALPSAVIFAAGHAQAQHGSAAHPSFAGIADELKDAVVTISTASRADEEASKVGKSGKKSQQAPEPFEEQFQDFFDRGGDSFAQQVTSVGSGFVIDAAGLIVTNNHVVEGGGDIYINFADGSRLKVDRVVGRDVKTDITLLKVTPKDGKPLKAVTFGDSSAVRVGDWVMAVGNPFGLGGTVTVGILSATNRDINAGPYDEFLQTDAAINRGNSGGPLFNSRGEVIGVNTAIISPTGGSIGLGFAVPSNTAKRIVSQLEQYGETRRGWIGVRVQSLNEDIAASLRLTKPEGALVASVETNGPAAAGGIIEGDVIVSFDGTPVRSSRHLPRLVAQSSVDSEVEIDVMRNGELKKLRVKVALLDEIGSDVVARAQKPELPGAPEKPKRQSMKSLSIAPLSPETRTNFALAPDIEGVVVTDVQDGPEGSHGLEPGDVIVEAAHQKIRSMDEFDQRIASLRAMSRDTALLTVTKRNGPISFVPVELN